MRSFAILDDRRGSKSLIQLLALFLALAIAPAVLRAQDWDQINGRDKVNDPAGAWLTTAGGDQFTLITFQKGGTVLEDIQGESAFDPGSVNPPTPPGNSFSLRAEKRDNGFLGYESGRCSNGESAHQSLVQTRNEASCAKCIKNVNGLPGLPVDGAEPDEDRRPESRPQTQDPDKPAIVVFNGERELLTNPRTSSCEDSVICKHGDYWTIQHDGQMAWLKATRGLESLACLLGHPGREFHVRELIGAASPDTGLDPWLGQQVGYETKTLRLQDAGPILDSNAKAEYKLRLAELRAELEDAERFNDLGRAEKIQEESNAIAEQLAGATGLGGRDRKAASHAERARTAVTKRIRGSIKRIGKATPSLGRHLDASIKTGYFCSYNPEPGCSVRWKLG
jgi:hypothetical protein